MLRNNWSMNEFIEPVIQNVETTVFKTKGLIQFLQLRNQTTELRRAVAS